MATKAEILADLHPNEVESTLEFLWGLRKGRLIDDDEFFEWWQAIIAFAGFHDPSTGDGRVN